MLSNVKPLAGTSPDTNGTMSDRLVSDTTNDKMAKAHQEISTSNSMYSHYSGWLDENREQLDGSRYVILDDDPASETRERYPDRFVQVNPDPVFSKQDADLAYEILNTVKKDRNRFVTQDSDGNRIELSSKWRDKASDELKNHIFEDCSFRDLITDKPPNDNSPYNTTE